MVLSRTRHVTVDEAASRDVHVLTGARRRSATSRSTRCPDRFATDLLRFLDTVR